MASSSSPWPVGRCVVVTGASQGIGRATALAVAAGGGHVVGCHRPDPGEDEKRDREGLLHEAAALAGSVELVPGDVGDPAFLAGLAEQAEHDHGAVDAWVNNAAVGVVRPFLETGPAELEPVLRTNLLGCWHGCQAAARLMSPRRRGAIVNVTSVGHVQPLPGLASYAAAKGAVRALTAALAVELGPLGLRVNAVSPGPTATPMNAGYHTPAVVARYARRVPLARIAAADEIAAAILFLIGDASSYVNGAELVVDGGLTLNGDLG